MKLPNSFLSRCNSCKNRKEIVVCHSWKGQKSQPNEEWVRGGWYNFCNPCSSELNMPHNRTPKCLNNNQKGGQNKQMAKLSERAQSYVATGTLKNISELSSVSIDVDVNEKIFAEGTEKEFTAEVFVIDGEEYKMPLTVISSLKVILEENSALKTFKVKKAGTGINTEYTVIPLS